jgi:hypothetical protein
MYQPKVYLGGSHWVGYRFQRVDVSTHKQCQNCNIFKPKGGGKVWVIQILITAKQRLMLWKITTKATTFVAW